VKWVVNALTNKTFSPVSGCVRTTDARHRELRMQREAFLGGHRRAEARLDAVAGAKAGNPTLSASGRALYASTMLTHIGVAADGRALDTAKHAAERRLLAPGRIGVPRVLVAIVRLVRRLVDAHEPRILGIAAGHRMSSSSPKCRANATCSARVMS
jgi:hypothetical protein